MAYERSLFLIFFMSRIYLTCFSEKVTYISVEHPRVTYFNPKYLTYVNLTTTRYGRRNPVYYVGFHFSNIVPFTNNVYVDFYIYEWLTNMYKPSFVEFHFTWCEMIEKDMFFGAALRQGKLLNPCPHKPDDYHLYNMTVNPAVIPRGFPFTRGRIYCNLTITKTKERVTDGYIDMRILQINKPNAKELFKH